MAIKYIDSITIDGKGNNPNRKLFNGYLYRLNYNIAMGQGKSKITANIVSEDGSYSISPNDLNYSRVYPVQIGTNISVNMFLESYKYIVEPDSKLIELSFSDTSVKLDRYEVGLYKRMGIITRDNIIIVGREIHPCDKDFDGKIDSIPDLADECHPCKNTANRDAAKVEIDCQELNKYAIFPVSYNFSELLIELRKIFKIQEPIDLNPKYRATYTGTVREVLNQWCSDFGMIFYWEDETIKFLDLRRTIQVSSNVSSFCPNLTAYQEEYSIEGTEDRILSTYYERPGSHSDFLCEDARYFLLPTYDTKTSGISSELRISNDIPSVAAGLARYSPYLRDLWYYYDFYSLRSASDYVIGKDLPKLGLTILSTPIMLNDTDSSVGGPGGGLETGGLGSSSLQPSEGLYAPNGFPLNPDPTSNIDFLVSSPPNAALATVQAKIQANEKYKMCFELLTAEDQWTVANGLTKNVEDFFFYIGLHEPLLQSAHYNEELEYAQEFMGRFYIYQPDMNNPKDKDFFEDYTFYEDKVCNIQIRTNDKRINYNILNDGGGGQVTFYNNPGISDNGDADTLSNLPFSRWLRLLRQSASADTAGQRARMFKLLIAEKQGELFYPTPGQNGVEDGEDGEESTDPKDAIKNPQLIKAAQKHASYQLEQKHNSHGEFVPRKVTELMNAPIDKNLDRSKISIFIGRAIGKDDFKVVKGNAVNVSNSAGTPFNGSPIITQYEDEFDLTGRVLYKYPDIRCSQIGNITNTCFSVSFKTPEAIFSYFEPSFSPYGVAVEKAKTIRHYPDKLQSNNMSHTKTSSKVAGIKVVQRDISDDDIAIFSNQKNSCRYNLAKIKEFHNIFAQNLDYVFDQPLMSKTFTIQGVNLIKAPKIADGLMGIEISMDDSGIQSTYNLGTRLMMPISDEVLKSQFIQRNEKLKADYQFIAPNRNSSNSSS